MTEFVEKDYGEGAETVEEYNKYCYYVAGLVGVGLSRMFAASEMEGKPFFPISPPTILLFSPLIAFLAIRCSVCA